MAKKWTIKFTEDATKQFEDEKIVSKNERKPILKRIVERLSFQPDLEQGDVKNLSKERPPFFDGKDVWQLTIRPFRFFYELFFQDMEVEIFFIGKKKKTETTQSMYERFSSGGEQDENQENE